jgi:nucleotide-binding universal stress UspA family protein
MTVLICYDGSPSAKVAVISAATTLDQAVFPRHDVTILNVWNEPLQAPTDSFSYKDDPHPPSGESLIDIAECRAQETVAEGKRLAMQHGLMPHTLVACNESSVAHTILRMADRCDSSLIILGAHPHGTPGPTLDSVSAAVVAGSSRPVMVIPMTKANTTDPTPDDRTPASDHPVRQPIANA